MNEVYLVTYTMKNIERCEKMKKNVGNLDAHMRLSLGYMMLGIGIIKKSKCMIAMGSMKIAEGITHFCPVLYVLGISTVEKELSDSICCKK
jgi:hypothetical protein